MKGSFDNGQMIGLWN